MEGVVMDKPRWINEIPKPVRINKKIQITDDMKKEAEEFERAVKSENMDKWFNKEV